MQYQLSATQRIRVPRLPVYGGIAAQRTIVMALMHDLLLETDQTLCYGPDGCGISCEGTGQDAAFAKSSIQRQPQRFQAMGSLVKDAWRQQLHHLPDSHRRQNHPDRPGHAARFEHVRRGLDGIGLLPEAVDLIVCTHAHPDHIEAVRLFKQNPVLFALPADQWRLVQAWRPT